MAAVPDCGRRWSPVGLALSGLFSGMSLDSMETTYQVLWWFHLLTACALIALVPLHEAGAHRHGSCEPDECGGPHDEGTARRHRLQRREQGDLRSRRRGGARQARSAFAGSLHALWQVPGCVSGVRVGQGVDAKAGHPRSAAVARDAQLTFKLRPAVNGDGAAASAEPTASASGASSIAHDVIWSCTTCGACAQICPVCIEHAPLLLVELRRYLVMIEGRDSRRGPARSAQHRDELQPVGHRLGRIWRGLVRHRSRRRPAAAAAASHMRPSV